MRSRNYWITTVNITVGTLVLAVCMTIAHLVAAQTTPATMALPVMYSPADGALNVTRSPILRWYALPKATWYTIQLSADSTFTTGVITRPRIAGTAVNLTQLDDNTTYYWRIKAGNSRAESSWSEPFAFSTIQGNVALVAPTLVSPLQGERDIPTATTLSWEDDGSGTLFQVQVARNGDFATALWLNNNRVTNSFLDVTGLAPGTQYWWRVRAGNGRVWGAWSTLWYFRTISGSGSAALDAPVLVSPANQDSAISLTPTLSWTAVTGAMTYVLQVAKDADFTMLIYKRNGLTTTSRAIPRLLQDFTYYWRVQAVGRNARSGWSPVFSFMTGGTTTALPAPLLLAPTDSAAQVATPATFTWNAVASATIYSIQIAKDSGFSLNPLAKDISAATTDTETLDANSQYYWRVRAGDGKRWSAWSTVRSFTTTDGSNLPVPTLLGPDDAAAGVPLPVLFSWNEAATASVNVYTLQIAKDAGFNTDLVTRANLTTMTQSETLEPGTQYYWQVRAGNGTSWSAWATARSFTTLGLTVPTLVTPDDNATNVVIPTQLSWSSAGSASVTVYNLQLAKDAGFTDGLTDKANLTTTSDTETLTSATQYYWRVRGGDGTNWSNWSAARTFTTTDGTGLTPPTLLTPNDAATQVASPVLFSWNAAASASVTVYNLQLAKDAGFTNGLIDKANLTTTSSTETLTDATQYYWRVRVGNGTAWSAWSTVRTFTLAGASTGLAAPMLNTPADAATNVALPAQLSWNAVSSATVYNLQLANDAGFTAGLVDKASLTATTDSEALTAGSTYYWRVRAGNGTVWSSWSTARSFTIAGAPTGLSAPTLNTPQDNALGLAISTPLTWNAVSSATVYNCQLATDAGFTVGLVDKTNLTGTTNTEALTAGTKYYWRVRAGNGASWGAWSTVRNFTTVAGLGVPTLLTPADATTSVAIPASLSWSTVASTVYYNLEIAKNTSFTSGLITSLIDAATTSIQQPLEYNTTYYWRVRATDGANAGGWSVVRSFTTIAGGTVSLAAPTLTEPLDNASTSASTEFKWSAVTGATMYNIAIAANTTFDPMVSNAFSIGNGFGAMGLLVANTPYHWRVRAGNSNGWGPWSAAWAFTMTASQ